MKDRRIGRFRIDQRLIDERPALVREIMGRCIIVRAEFMFGGYVEYLALCDDFDAISSNEIPNDYAVRVRHNEDGPVVFEKWRKLF